MSSSTTQAAAGEACQYLVFRLGGLDYALDFTKVQELRPLQALERISYRRDRPVVNGRRDLSALFKS